MKLEFYGQLAQSSYLFAHLQTFDKNIFNKIYIIHNIGEHSAPNTFVFLVRTDFLDTIHTYIIDL